MGIQYREQGNSFKVHLVKPRNPKEGKAPKQDWLILLHHLNLFLWVDSYRG